MARSAENFSIFSMKLCEKHQVWQIRGKIGKKFIKHRENVHERHEHCQFFTFSLELNFFPFFLELNLSPPPREGGGALLAKIFTLVDVNYWSKGVIVILLLWLAKINDQLRWITTANVTTNFRREFGVVPTIIMLPWMYYISFGKLIRSCCYVVCRLHKNTFLDQNFDCSIYCLTIYMRAYF